MTIDPTLWHEYVAVLAMLAGVVVIVLAVVAAALYDVMPGAPNPRARAIHPPPRAPAMPPEKTPRPREWPAPPPSSTVAHAELVALLRRYRNETPLGHQPHMIAHRVDRVLEALEKPQGPLAARDRRLT